MASNGMSGNQKTIVSIIVILAVVGLVVFIVNSCQRNSETTMLSNMIKMFFPK
jgi:hypothetical protein